MILINGTNFIDGLNGLVLSYYLVIIILIFKLGLFEYSFLDNLNIYYSHGCYSIFDTIQYF